MSYVIEVVVGKCNNYCIRRHIGRMGMYDQGVEPFQITVRVQV